SREPSTSDKPFETVSARCPYLTGALSRGRDGALRRPRRVSGATLDVKVTPLAFVPPARRGRGHRSAMSLPQGLFSRDLDAFALAWKGLCLTELPKQLPCDEGP